MKARKQLGCRIFGFDEQSLVDSEISNNLLLILKLVFCYFLPFSRRVDANLPEPTYPLYISRLSLL